MKGLPIKTNPNIIGLDQILKEDERGLWGFGGIRYPSKPIIFKFLPSTIFVMIKQ